MPNTAQGFPYPSPADPLTQGAAAIQALAAEVDKRHLSVCTYKSPGIAVGAGASVNVIGMATAWADWIAGDFSAGITIPVGGSGRYRITADFTFVGQSGGVNPSYGQVIYRNGAGTQLGTYWAVIPILNAGGSVSRVLALTAGDYFTFTVYSGAGAVGGACVVSAVVERLK